MVVGQLAIRRNSEICQLGNGQRVVIVRRGTNNHRYRLLPDDGVVDPISESFLADTQGAASNRGAADARSGFNR